MQRIFIIFLLFWLSNPVMAFNLFGININNTERVALREEIRKTGANVIREAGDDNWYDIYDMSASFKQSKRLFVGYDKNSGRFAFAEYQLNYDYFKTMLQRLEAKYGKAEIRYGMFESDAKYVWLIDGVNIELSQDWSLNISRLIYSLPENLQQLQQAYYQFQSDEFSKSLSTNEIYY